MSVLLGVLESSLDSSPVEEIKENLNENKFLSLFYRPIAIGALITTVLACLLVVVQSILDHGAREEAVIHFNIITYRNRDCNDVVSVTVNTIEAA
jgi:hypothetical protein